VTGSQPLIAMIDRPAGPLMGARDLRRPPRPAGPARVPALVAAAVWWRRRRPAVGIAHPDLDLIVAADPGPRRRRLLPALLALLALAAFVVALARPQVWRDEPRAEASIVLAIDVSGSMAADADGAPYRLQAAQEAALRSPTRCRASTGWAW